MPSNDHCWCGSGGVSSAARELSAGTNIVALSTAAATRRFSISGVRHRRPGTAEARPAALKHRTGDAERQWSRPLELADQREQDQQVDKVIKGRDLADGHDEPLRRVGADPAESDDVDHQEPEDPFVDWPEPGAAHP